MFSNRMKAVCGTKICMRATIDMSVGSIAEYVNNLSEGAGLLYGVEKVHEANFYT